MLIQEACAELGYKMDTVENCQKLQDMLGSAEFPPPALLAKMMEKIGKTGNHVHVFSCHR